MGILVLLGCLLAVSFAALLTLFLRHRALLTRFARVIDVDREVTAQRQEVERLQRHQRVLTLDLPLLAEARAYCESVRRADQGYLPCPPSPQAAVWNGVKAVV